MTTGIKGLNWYVAKIIYQVVVGDGLHTPQFDEQYRLIRADELAWAWEKAQVLGRLGECNFGTSNGKVVQWKFINVTDVCGISEIEDGAQLYAQTEEPYNVEEYIAISQARADRLKRSTKEQPLYFPIKGADFWQKWALLSNPN